MIKIISSIIMFLCFATFTIGQSTFKKNNIYLEAGGNGLWGSLNYERQLTKDPGLGLRIGAGFYTEYNFFLNLVTGINYLFKLKNNKSFIDAGLGITWTGIDEKSSKGLHFVNFIPSIGYRRHTSKNLMWRISLTPVINKYGGVPWVGVSIGKRF